MNAIRLLLLACALASPLRASAATDAEIESSIDVVLSQRHPKETAAWWRSLGPAAPRVMIGMYRKTDDTYRRIRVVEALGWFSESPEALEFLKELGESADAADVVRMAAIRGVGRSQGARELDFVAGFLKHPDAQTRLTAAETLKGMDDPRAKDRLEAFLSSEKAGWLVARVRGEPVAVPGKLKPVSSSEDRVNPAFSGEWQGFWIAPRPEQGPLEARPASAKLEIKELTRLEGSMSIQFQKGAPFQGSWAAAAVDALKARGKIASSNPAGSPLKTEPVAPQGEWRMELLEQPGGRGLAVYVPAVGGAFYFNKKK